MRGTGRIVAERLDQNILRWVCHTSGPLEPQASRLAARRLGERAGDLRPLVGVLGQYPELGGNEDHEAPSSGCGEPSSRTASGAAAHPEPSSACIRST